MSTKTKDTKAQITKSTDENIDAIARQKAIKRVEELKDFYQHLQSYVAVNLILLLINLFTFSEIIWVKYVAFFWGIGLLLHALRTFWSGSGLWGSNWEEKKIAELTEKFK
jgi:uncharacterized membrane protein